MAGERIVSLLPSATEIVGCLGLSELLTGVSHECDILGDGEECQRYVDAGTLFRVTSSTISPHDTSQAMVSSSLLQGLSLYSILPEAFAAANPTLIITQGLCEVCAPSGAHVAAACSRLPGAGGADSPAVRVLNLEPHVLADVAATFPAVAEAATGSAAAGLRLAERFTADIARIASLCDAAAEVPAGQRRMRAFLMEWVNPVFDGGHWVPELLVAAGCTPGTREPGDSSRVLDVKDLVAYDPDFLLVACCGFDLSRNIRDAQTLWEKPWFRDMRCVQAGRVFAADGNRYFARPSPSLVGGGAIVARCMAEVAAEWGQHDSDAGLPPPAAAAELVGKIERSGLLPARGVGWERVPLPTSAPAADPSPAAAPPLSAAAVAGCGAAEAAAEQQQDIEDLALCWRLHDEASEQGLRSYIDPKTGYQVLTAAHHKSRGRCCGYGCRHCPFAHAGVPDREKAHRIQQPAWLVGAGPSGSAAVDLHFWSGGKDSFLAVRALQREQQAAGAEQPRRIVLISTFDARTRIVAHQELHIDTLMSQAKALGLPMLGVPLQPGRGYETQVEEAVRVALAAAGDAGCRLCFGDLHLEPIKQWREEALGKVADSLVSSSACASCTLHFPLWKVPYDTLLDDLEASGWRAEVSAVEEPHAAAPGIRVGAAFGRALMDEAGAVGWDAFGENGEFHTVVRPPPTAGVVAADAAAAAT